MSNRQLVKLAFCICLLPLFFSCSSERDEGSEGSGTLHIQVNADPEVVVGTNTRVDNGTEQEVPDVNDFSFSIFKGETLRHEWSTFSEYLSDDALSFRSGNDYIAKASHGDITKEGFEFPYYEGSQQFIIKKGQTTEVEVTCLLANAKLSIVYTDEFKDYFSSYSSEISSSLGNVVKYIASEERYAYFKPGEVTATVKVKREGSSSEVILGAGKYSLKPRYAYTLTLDVDAGSPVLTVTFSDEIPNQEPIQIDISDEALSAPAPYFTANGFDEGNKLDIVEGQSAVASSVYAYLNAMGTISHCYMTTTSSTLRRLGWPEGEVDLANLTDGQREAMQKYGLRLAGLEGNKDKLAMVDLTGVIPFLEYNNENAVHVFTLKAIDKLSKVSEPLVVTINSLDNKFSVTTPETSVNYGTTKLQLDITLIGDPMKVSYWLKTEKGEQSITPKNIQSESNGEEHLLTFVLTEPQTANVEIEARYLSRQQSATWVVDNNPLCILSAEPGDVWTKKATLQVDKAVESEWKFECRKGNVWKVTDCPVTDLTIPLAGLPQNTSLGYRFVLRDDEGDIIRTSTLLDIQTEEEMQIPNSDFEQWTDKQTWTNIGVIATGGETIYAFFPYAVEGEQWWNTRNLTTTQKVSGTYYSWYYAVYPGTVPTNAGKLHTATWHLNTYDKQNFKIEPHGGEAAVEIATVAWGLNHWTTRGPTDIQYRTAGSLYVGTYDENTHSEELGKSFSSRPTSVKFYYKYYSYNYEYTKPYVIVYDVNGQEIGKGEITIDNTVNSFTEGRIPIKYEGENKKKKAAAIAIVFLSTSVDAPSIKSVKGSVDSPWGWGGYSDARHIGSILTIDDVSLEYAY